ncbi:MAG: IclR family transcriptional regulator [Rhodospirillales bacterium]|nr:IclR family transcriptional regulator [Rhodospirillales bacterium]
MAKPDTRKGSERDIVRSVVKAFRILEIFTDIGTDRTIAEIARAAGVDRGVAYRMVVTLEHLGYLEHGRADRTFRLALKCMDLGLNALAGLDIRAIANPKLRSLVPDFADAASLAVLDGAEVVYIDRVEENLTRLGLVRRIGSRVPVYGTAVGFALLSDLPRERQIAILGAVERVKLSERTVTDLSEILNILSQTAARGYAVSDQQNAFGLRTLAAPIADADGNAIASISLTIAAERMDMEAFELMAVPKLQETAQEISRATQALSEVGLSPSVNAG